MAKKYDLHHWDNNFIKNVIIIVLCMFKNNIYLVKKNDCVVATFQIKKIKRNLYLEKLAINPKYQGKDIGTYCIDTIERIAKDLNCNHISLECLDKSEHAIKFYEKNNYIICDEKIHTLKYVE